MFMTKSLSFYQEKTYCYFFYSKMFLMILPLDHVDFEKAFDNVA